jgi:hypothetical protein
MNGELTLLPIYSITEEDWRNTISKANTFLGKKFTQEDDDVYILQNVQEGILVVELKSCIGSFTMSAASSYDNLLKKNYDLTFNDNRQSVLY